MLRLYKTLVRPHVEYCSSIHAVGILFSKRQRLRLRNAIAIPSVVCLSVCRLLSVTLVHATQAVELFGNFLHHTIAQGLYFSGAKIRWWGTPLSP